MEYIPLGETNAQVPKIGFGTWKYSGGTGVLKRAVELGANLVDTAESYNTERIVGQEIAGFREKMFVATKVSPRNLRHDDVLSHAEASLKALNIATIDLYQVHWPSDDIPIAETMRAFEELVAAGKIRFIGVSNFSVDQMKAAHDSLKANPLASNQVKYNLFTRSIETDILPYCQQHNIAVMAYSPLTQGKLDQVLPGSGVDDVVRQTGKTVGQVLLNWVISHPGVFAIPKTDRVERVDEDCGAVGWSLTDAQRKRLEASA